MSEKYLHTKPRPNQPTHVFEHPGESIPDGYTHEALAAVCGSTESHGRFYTGLPTEANVESDELCGNCRRIIEAREREENGEEER